MSEFRRPAVRNGSKVEQMGYRVRFVPLPEWHRKAFVDGLLAMSSAERARHPAAPAREHQECLPCA